MKMQQAGRLQAADHIEMDDIPVPMVGDRDILIEVAACGICGSDLHLWKQGALPSGSVMGHEFAGRIVEAGAGVSGLSIGDRVTVNPMLGGIGLGRAQGAFARFVRVDAAEPGRNVFILPPAISDEQGALIEPFAVGLHAVHQSGVQPGDPVVIYGAGTIGLCVLAGLRARGVRDILVLDLSAARREVALAMGATAVFDPASGDAVQFVMDHFGSVTPPLAKRVFGNARVAFDCAGAPRALQDAVDSLRTGGTLVLVAVYPGPVSFDVRAVVLRELNIVGALAYADEFAQAIALIEAGKVDLKPLITHRFALADLPDAFVAQASSPDAVKVMIDIGAAARPPAGAVQG